MATKKQIEDMTTDELETLLNKKKAFEKNAQKEKREQYEKNREEMVMLLGADALIVAERMERLKKMSMTKLSEFRQTMLSYGQLRGGDKNKGSFEVKNERFKIQFSSHVIKKFDERALLAEKKMNEFLTSFVRKRDAKLFDFISSLMKRKEETGEFDHDMISRLYSREDDFDDKNWKESIQLFKESYSPTDTSVYVRFFVKKAEGGWSPILLDFAKVKGTELATNTNSV